MTWVYEVLEIYDRRKRPLGQFRLVRWPAEKPDSIQGLCDHNHQTVDAALNCQRAQHILGVEFRERVAAPNSAATFS